MAVRISGVEKNSLAYRKKIEKDDILISINGNEINDVLDYRFYINDTKLVITLKTADGKSKLAMIRKDEFEDIGLEFETYLMDKQRSCKNKCIFCFIDQLPKGLRKSLYFKDDDSRLSFLFGNYITLTNLTDDEVERIIKMHISPVNVSVHTMNPELRVEMMKNPRAGDALNRLKAFADAGIVLNTQLVLCPDINDGKELEFSLNELSKLYPAVQSIAAVPVGLSDHREGLYELKPYDEKTAGGVIDTIDRFNDEFRKKNGTVIAYAADEFYIKANRPMPDEDYYNGYPQLDNGVGMWTLLKAEFEQALEDCDIKSLNRRVTVVTGVAAYPLISELSKKAEDKIKGLTVQVVSVKNKLLGSMITVSGLLCGSDIADAVSELDLGDELIIPPNCLRSEGDMFLDDMTVTQLSEKLGVEVKQNGSSGYELLSAMTGGI
jgi:putative radical SAM enzyme (TIGR03279 family)